MKRRSALLLVGLIVGVTLIALGVLFIRAGSIVGLGIGIESDDYRLEPPTYDWIVAGVLLTVVGSIAVSISLTLIIAPRWMKSEPRSNRS